MNAHPTRMLGKTELLFKYGGSSVLGAEFGHLPDNITVLEGESVSLRCRIDEERVTLVNTSNREFSIHIDKVQVTDEGLYTCTFQANNKPRIAHVYLIVQVPARIVNISKSVSVNEGENVNLYCLAIGRPEPTVTWKDQKFIVCDAAQQSTEPRAGTSPVEIIHTHRNIEVYRRKGKHA
ncbi:hypothetical protein CRENBAI_016796 [Crenichthys baileyi]|uniref:Ig-like domain-containing protein n=1 Tax=Crenichthys baileyi TaxID=28760 RepID=A0AAV9SI57_9TELE